MSQDINTLINEYKRGNTEPLEEILRLSKPIIMKTANSFHTDMHTNEDLIQQGYLIVVDSIKNYDQSKNILFYGYLKKCLLYNYYKMLNQREISCLNKIMDDGLEFLDTVSDTGLCIEDEVIDKELRSTLYKAINSLPEKQKSVIVERFFNNRNLNEIAAEQGVNYINILKRNKKALHRLRDALGDMYAEI